MSGHSKWATVKRKKAVTDAKRGAIFTKLAKNIAIAARRGKDPEMNAALRTAMDQAKAVNMPKNNIEKAILKGAGEVPGATYEETRYEGYGPGGIALVIECVTDNPKRTVSDIRNIITKYSGTLGESGSVLYMFTQCGVVRIAQDDLASHDQEKIVLTLIEAGAEDIITEDEGMTIIANRDHLTALLEILRQQNITPATTGVEWTTKNTITPTAQDAQKITQLIAALEDNDDVNAVFTNANI